jgi:WhiB family redox-sensing transcriptional regulator
MSRTRTSTGRVRTDAAPPSYWRDDAACAQTDPDLFFPTGDNMTARAQAQQAKGICAGCPVRRECLAWALETRQDQGVWGGMTEAERYAIHRRRSSTEWGRSRNIAQALFESRRDEFVALVEQGQMPGAIAHVLGTNVQTVNRLLEMLAAEETAEKVSAV